MNGSGTVNDLKVGFARVDITPMLGANLIGYYMERPADGVIDPLEVNAVAVQSGGKTAVMLAADNEGIHIPDYEILREHICECTGVDRDAVFISATHTHLAALINAESENAQEKEYFRFVYNRFADAAVMAIADLKAARMGYGIAKAPNIAFVRRFRMKDGSVATNPGVGNPDIVAPIGEIDDNVCVVRFDREGADTVVIASFACHPDTIGGRKVSADWPGQFRRTLEKAIDNTRCIFFNGAEGDINHVNVNAKGGDFNDLFVDFDDVSRGYGHTRHMGRVVAGAVMQVYDKVNYVDVSSVNFKVKTVMLPSNMPTPEQLPLARKYFELHNSGRDSEIPFTGMGLTTVVAEAGRMLRLEHGPEAFPLNLSALSVGGVAFIGIAGEAFNAIGRELKKCEGWDMVVPLGLTNGQEGYFPTEEAYIEGGYEARSSPFKQGVAELIIAEGAKLLEEIKQQNTSVRKEA